MADLNWKGWQTTSELAQTFTLSNRRIQQIIEKMKELGEVSEALLVRFDKKVQRYLPIFRRINVE